MMAESLSDAASMLSRLDRSFLVLGSISDPDEEAGVALPGQRLVRLELLDRGLDVDAGG
jgi:hypothetical protein